MGRLVEQTSIRTIVNKLKTNPQTKCWITGIKVDKWSVGDVQEFDVKYAKPQEVLVSINEKNSWRNIENSTHAIKILNFNGVTEISGREINQYGIKFFKTKELAEKYFLEKSHKLFKFVNPILEIHRELYKQTEYEDPHFLENIK